ncbi:CRISPR-associated protein Cas2 [Virgibacillus dokdonensis]|uniref:CRISPR-associated protein Cas2 n=1 Tax=Virgibacillus dokdonensis TaxID=302167 RepID=A0A3E0WHE8_9BACI|nr:ATP-binding protein [Virgibacillus dokdonensis]RFA32400.1 CRISPR-associated protein Cas2 [Virgibacillus dokdonensis]
MRRLVVITVGKTHSGKSTFARELEKQLSNSLIMDQDNHAAFIHTYYPKLQPTIGSNKLKYAISQLIVDYIKENTNFHLIICNSNRSKAGRKYLLEQLFPKGQYTRIIVHFHIPDEVLQKRIKSTKRSTNILRSAKDFAEVLARQNALSIYEDTAAPTADEADYLFTMKNNEEVDAIIKRIVQLASG